MKRSGLLGWGSYIFTSLIAGIAINLLYEGGYRFWGGFAATSAMGMTYWLGFLAGRRDALVEYWERVRGGRRT